MIPKDFTKKHSNCRAPITTIATADARTTAYNLVSCNLLPMQAWMADVSRTGTTAISTMDYIQNLRTKLSQQHRQVGVAIKPTSAFSQLSKDSVSPSPRLIEFQAASLEPLMTKQTTHG